LHYWNALSPGARDTIVGGLILAVITFLVACLWEWIVAGLRRLLRWLRREEPRGTDPAKSTVININVEVPQPSHSPPLREPSIPVSAPRPTSAIIPRPPVVGFVARRDKEGHDIVQRLKQELAPDKNQLVALWGPGGVGKTTLAAEAVRNLTDSLAPRVAWASAEGRADFTLATLLDEVATQLGRSELRQLALEPKSGEVTALVAAAPTLLVLDNFETIALEEQTRCAQWLKEHAPCPALITTRDRVGVARNIAIDAMSPDEAREFLQRLIAQAADASAFEGLDRDQIVGAAGANPLVLQWVVAQVELAQEWRSVLAELAQGKGDAAERVFERSVSLPQVGDDGRAALLALSLFVPSASRAALAGVAGLGDDLARLNEAVKHLAALWLVKTADGGQRLTVEGLTRELAKARLSSHEDADKFRRRFVKHFLSFAEAHTQTESEDFDALEAERDNLLAAMDAADAVTDWESVGRIRAALEDFLDLRGYWEEAIRRGEQALRAARNLSNDAWVAQFAHNLAIIYQNRGELEEARRLYQESLEINRKLGNQGGIANSLHQLGTLAQGQGQVEEARRLYRESLEIMRKLGNQGGIAGSLHELGRLAQGQGQVEEARRLYQESLEIEQKLGNQGGISSSLGQLGILAQDQGQVEEARRLYQESLEINRKLGNQGGIAISLHQLGMLAERDGNKTDAGRLFREALKIFEKLKSPNAEIARKSLHRVE